MRAFVVAMAVLAVASAQTNFGFPSLNRQQARYQGQYNPYQGQYQGQYQNQFQPFQYQNQNRYNYPTYKPFAFSTTAAPVRQVVPVVTAAPPVVSSAAPVVAPSPVPVVAAPSPVIIAKVVSNEKDASIVKYGNEINPDGSYNYFYETNNGIAAQEQGVPRNFGGNPPVVPDVAQGAFSWTSPEGQVISVTYVADENGYQPQSDAIPKAPEIPAQIARALEYIAKYSPVNKE